MRSVFRKLDIVAVFCSDFLKMRLGLKLVMTPGDSPSRAEHSERFIWKHLQKKPLKGLVAVRYSEGIYYINYKWLYLNFKNDLASLGHAVRDC